MDPILNTLFAFLEPKMFLSLSCGVLAGLVGGSIPGITITTTTILTLPFTFGMPPLQGLATMIGVYVGGGVGGAGLRVPPRDSRHTLGRRHDV
jgi:putative tricarboxylic transport membrane protein